MLVIGSVAMAHHGIKRSDVLLDIDVMAYENELSMFEGCEVIKEYGNKKVFFDGEVHYEVEIATPDSNQEMLLKILEVEPDASIQYADKDVLYALKMSHRFKKNSSHFLKTMRDIHLMRDNWGCESVSERLQDWFKVREGDTYTYDHPNLNQDKDGFFDTSVFKENPYKYDHDSLHEAVKLLDKPAYTYFLDGPVKVSKQKFENLPRYTQLCSVFEESCVLALERAIIPHNTSQDRAFQIALGKVCTSIASGWWREFAWENYKELVAMYRSHNVDLLKLLEEGVSNGTVKPFKEEVV